MSEIDSELPLWGATIWHSTPVATNPQTFVFEFPIDGERREALRKVIGLFKAQGLNEITIYDIEIAPLAPFGKGGENGK